ncbi:MAG TPA: hypothetical protein VKR55_29645 [Bradyrhizobium sp.]|uniref:COG3904 family protein n=1 Tax=Bradyrhizobium sp. TaxID=376 RepID=UPI002B61AEA5|nr:hypothetical protein [Bradyrhizobium sp.]HLZ06303.1 hypothetical protein [Bradyrhizobium sp.]
MPVDDRKKSQPTGPWVRPPAPGHPPSPPSRLGNRRLSWSAVFFMLILLSVGIRAFKDLSRPEAWAYWKDEYFSPSLNSSRIPSADFDGSGRGRPALAIRGRIGPAAASWLRTQLEQAHLAPGDLVLLSSPGGDVGQAVIMGEIIRSRGLATAVGTADDSGRVRSAYCASACVLAFAGGKPRYGVEGSLLGVHRFVTTARVRDPVADTQRTTGMLLGYMTKMGVSSSVVEAMSETSAVRWLAPKEALAMNLVTDPLRKP